jgi:D-amino-acid dehydrogenase
MEVLVIGGGVIGVCYAHYLVGSWCGVTLIEKGRVGDGCSYGNAGLIVPSHRSLSFAKTRSASQGASVATP